MRFGEVRVTVEQPPPASSAAAKVIEVCAKSTVRRWTFRTARGALPDVRLAVATEISVDRNEADAASAAALVAIRARRRAAVGDATAIAVGAEVLLLSGSAAHALTARLPPWKRAEADAVTRALGARPSLEALRATGLRWVVASAAAVVDLSSTRLDLPPGYRSGSAAPREDGMLRLTNLAGVAMLPIASGLGAGRGGGGDGAMAPPPPRKKSKITASPSISTTSTTPCPVPAARYSVEVPRSAVAPVAVLRLTAAADSSASTFVSSAAAPLRRLREKRRTSFIDARGGWRIDVSRTRSVGNDDASSSSDSLFRELEAAPTVYEIEFEAAPDAHTHCGKDEETRLRAAVALVQRSMDSLFGALLTKAGLPPLPCTAPRGSAIERMLGEIAANECDAAVSLGGTAVESGAATDNTGVIPSTLASSFPLGWNASEWSTWCECPRQAKTPLEGASVAFASSSAVSLSRAAYTHIDPPSPSSFLCRHCNSRRLPSRRLENPN